MKQQLKLRASRL